MHLFKPNEVNTNDINNDINNYESTLQIQVKKAPHL